MRINFNMNTEDCVVAMSDGNLGAIAAMCEMINADFVRGSSALVRLDEAGIYGESIYLLWSDGCDRNAEALIAVIESKQALGAVTAYRVFTALEMLAWGMKG